MAKLVSQPYTDADKIITPTTPNAKDARQISGIFGVFLILLLMLGAAAVLIGAFRL